MYDLQYFFHSKDGFITFLMVFFDVVLNMDEGQLIYFSFDCFYLGIISKK